MKFCHFEVKQLHLILTLKFSEVDQAMISYNSGNEKEMILIKVITPALPHKHKGFRRNFDLDLQRGLKLNMNEISISPGLAGVET